MLRELREAEGRRTHRAFLVEGSRLVGEAVDSGWPLITALFDEERARTDAVLAALVKRIPGASPATARAVKHAAETVSPQGIVAAARLPDQDAKVHHGDPLILVIDGVADPGNAGTLLRSAVGSGVRHVLATKGTVDLFSPKVVRAGMGAHFRLSLDTNLDWEKVVELAGRHRTFVVAMMRGDTPYYSYDWRSRSALVIGSEATGPSDAAVAAAATQVAIPIEPALESLNAAVAGSVILFEAKRQRDGA